GPDFVVDEDGRAVPELEDTGGDDFVPGPDAGDDRDLVAARGAERDDLLAHTAVGLTICILEVGDDKDRIAVRRVADGRGRHRHDRTTGALGHFRLNEHSGPQPAVRI